MPKGSKPGERRGGRRKGTPNKATAEARQKALMDLAAQAQQATAAGKKLVLAKDELLDLIPVVKGAVAAMQAAAIDSGNGMPGQRGFNPEKWSRFKEWAEFFALVCYRAADFQSPKFRAIAVAASPGDANPGPQPRTIEGRNVAEQDRERVANATYLKLVKGG